MRMVWVAVITAGVIVIITILVHYAHISSESFRFDMPDLTSLNARFPNKTPLQRPEMLSCKPKISKELLFSPSKHTRRHKTARKR